jgi:hypothetical protein
MDWTKLIPAVEEAANLVQELAPIAGGLAGPGGAAIGAAIAAGAKWGESLLTLAQSAGDVLSTSDLAKIEAATTTLQAANDGLAQQIGET